MPILRVVAVVADAVLRQRAPGRGGRKFEAVQQCVVHTDIVGAALEAGSQVIDGATLPRRFHVLTKGVQNTPSPVP